MLRRTLVALFFSTAALAMPAPDSSDDLFGDIPSSIAAVMATAVPTAWAMSYATDEAFAKSVESAEAAGTMPAWYSSLPDSVQAYYTSAAAAELGLTMSASATTTAAANTDAASTAASSQASSTSTGGAAAATGGLVLSAAGAAGILGLALGL